MKLKAIIEHLSSTHKIVMRTDPPFESRYFSWLESHLREKNLPVPKRQEFDLVFSGASLAMLHDPAQLATFNACLSKAYQSEIDLARSKTRFFDDMAKKIGVAAED